jgi:hypothetical protein
MIALLKILLAAAPTSKAKTDSINIMTDVLPEEMPMTVMQSMKLGIDVNRHKEIIVKAVSGILLLLLKHFKVRFISFVIRVLDVLFLPNFFATWYHILFRHCKRCVKPPDDFQKGQILQFFWKKQSSCNSATCYERPYGCIRIRTLPLA